MDKKFNMNIDGRKQPVNKYLIASLFGAAGTVCDSYDHETVKFAFYNTGYLCQVTTSEGSRHMKVEVMDGCESRKEDILGWLKTYLINGLAYLGYEAEIVMMNGWFNAKLKVKNDD